MKPCSDVIPFYSNTTRFDPITEQHLLDCDRTDSESIRLLIAFVLGDNLRSRLAQQLSRTEEEVAGVRSGVELAQEFDCPG